MSKSTDFKRNITILAGLSLATMHVINRIQTTSANSNNQTHTREDKEYEWRYGKISYKKKGYGSPLLLIHDLTIGSNKDEFSLIINELSKNHTVYAIDLLGYGDSDKTSMTYTAAVYEQLISDFIKNIIGTKADIVVTGDSAPIVLKLAQNNSDFIGRIIMINPLGLYDQNLIPSNETKFMKYILHTPILGTFVYNLLSTKQEIRNTFLTKNLANPDKMKQEVLEDFVSSYFRSAHASGHNSKYSYASYISKYMTCSVLHELKELNSSILIIGGSKEKEINDNIENYLYYNNAIEYQIIEDTAHLPHIEKSKEIIEDIEVFLS